jgi:hypothetical protein
MRGGAGKVVRGEAGERVRGGAGDRVRGGDGGLLRGAVQEHQFKTVLCKNWEAEGRCQWDEHCKFAHGREDPNTGRSARGPGFINKKITESTSRPTSSG